MDKQTNHSIFEMSDFRPYIRSWARSKGRGEYRQISLALGIHTTLLSQILSGKKCLTEEQASKFSRYMSLNLLESDCFLKLVQLERAGTEELRRVFERHLKQIQTQAREIKSRVPDAKEMTEQDRAIFYSSWQYSMIRLLTSIDAFQTQEAIASYTDLPISRVQEVLEFLISRKLCVIERGKFKRTKENTHVESRSPLALRHHQNWRVYALSALEKMQGDDLAFTAPVSLSGQDIVKVRAILIEAISEISRLIEKSPSEHVAYLAIDWLRF